MNNRVYTYTKITELKKAPYFSEIAALPQLTMSMELAASMALDMRIFRRNIMGFSNFQQRLFLGWNTSGQKFVYRTILNQFFRERISAAKDKAEKDWLFGCKKNLFLVIKNVIHLEEANVRPEDLAQTDRDIILFVDMWKRLESADDTIHNFRKRFEELKDASIFSNAVNNIFKFHGKKQIVWNGFQFFTPMQQYVFECFQNAGYEIFALIPYEERYPYANEIWDFLYRPEKGFPEKERWIKQESVLEKNPLGEIFETGEKTSAENIKIIKYQNTIEFIEDIPRIKRDGYFLYCADDRTANAMLKEYYPEKYEVRNLLSYPIGQFVYALHQMWDETMQGIVLTQNGLRTCFASGWLFANGRSSANFTEELERLLPYFHGCYKIEEWMERLETFENIYENVVSVFKDQPCDLGDPFQYFSAFSMKKDRLDGALAILRQLLEMANRLFDKKEPISIQAHMSKLDAMLSVQKNMQTELYLEERKKVNRIFDSLENEKMKDFLCHPGDLSAALVSFMRDSEEEQNNTELQTLVFNVFQVEAAPIAAKEKIHICLADITRLPGAVGQYSWPLEEGVLQSILTQNKNTYLSNWIENNRLTALSNRYYFYTALKNEDIEISWIQKQGEKLYSPSPYITLLEKLSDSKIRETTMRTGDLSHVAEITPQKRLDRMVDLREQENPYDYEHALSYAVCPMRFVYGYVLGDGTTYRTEYQQNRAVVRLIQTLYALLKETYSIEQIADQVFELFPNIRKAEKRQMIDDAVKWSAPEKEGDYTVYEDKQYTNYRWNLSFLDEQSYQQAKSRAAAFLNTEEMTEVFAEHGFHTGTRNCEFCPHSVYCMDALYGVDYKNEGIG